MTYQRLHEFCNVKNCRVYASYIRIRKKWKRIGTYYSGCKDVKLDFIFIAYPIITTHKTKSVPIDQIGSILNEQELDDLCLNSDDQFEENLVIINDHYHDLKIAEFFDNLEC